MSRAEDDEIERLLREANRGAIDADARHVSGDDIRVLREALASAATAMSRINAKGLPFAHRRDFEQARAAIEDARRRLARPLAQQDAGPQAGA